MAEAGAQAVHTLGCRELSEANPSAKISTIPTSPTRSGKFCFVMDERLFLKCRIVGKDKAKAKGVPFQPVLANNRKSQPLYISCGRSLKMPVPVESHIDTQSEAAWPAPAAGWCIQTWKRRDFVFTGAVGSGCSIKGRQG